MRRPQGFLICDDPDPARGQAVRVERETFTCAHCSRVVVVEPRCDPADAGGLCRQCGGLICPRCVATGRCDPLERKIERAERRHETLRSYGLS